MKQLLITFFSLLAAFCLAWNVKANTPINRPSNIDDGHVVAWYESNNVAPIANSAWTLDHTIPGNYIPVPGRSELYMVIGEDGKITGYKQRTQLEDGTWEWSDANPDIPEGYEPFEGIKDVYKITNADGTVSYVKYIRNDDDTFCFVPVDENGIPLDVGTSAEKISSNYVHETGNIYAMYNDEGVKMGYRERVENTDGTHTWKLSADPTTPSSGFGTNGFSSSDSESSPYYYSVGSDLPQTQTEDASLPGMLELSDGEQDGASGDSQTYAQPSQQFGTDGEMRYATDGVSDAYANIVSVGVQSDGYAERTYNTDGTYTMTETTRTTEIENGIPVTYETKIIKVYDSDNNLLTSKQEGPYPVME